MKFYTKPVIRVLSFGLSDRVAADECMGDFFPEIGGQYRWRIDGPSFLEFARGNTACEMFILDGLNVSAL